MEEHGALERDCIYRETRPMQREESEFATVRFRSIQSRSLSTRRSLMDTNPITEMQRSETPNLPPPTIRKRAVTGWILYDLANTIFSMGVISLNFPLWIRDAVGPARADANYGIITAVSMVIIFFASPLLGAMTDRAKRRMPFLIGSTLVFVGFTAFLARFGFYWTAAFFVIANIAYQAGTQFYDAMLPEVSTEENRGRIGGIGVGIGYLGSYIAVAVGIWVESNGPARSE